MTDNVKRVFYVRYVAHPCYLDMIAQRPEIRLDKLENDTPQEMAQPILAAAHAYQIGSARDELAPRFHVNRDLVSQMPKLLVVSTNGAGFDTVDVMHCTQAGVLVVNQSGGNAEAVAAHVVAMVLTLSKQIIQTHHALRQGTMRDRTAFMGNDVKGRTIGVIGLGNVGRRVAELCRGVLGMEVMACDPYLDEQTIAARGAAKVTLDEVLQRSDFVSVNCPLDQGTRGMIGAREFALMQPHAYFINTARGFIHDEQALAQALRGKKIAGAGLDVWDREPPPADHPLLQFDNVIASPHTAGMTHQARTNMGRIAAEQLIMTLDGKCPPRVVNPQVWPAYANRFEQTFGFRPQESPARHPTGITDNDMISERVHPLDAQALALFEAKGTHGWFPAGNVNGVKARRVMQIIRDFHKTPFEALRIFDFACGEGVYAIEAALRGANVIGFDARMERMQAGQDLGRRLRLEKLKFEQADVRHITVSSHGAADIILFLGILYHLDDRDIFPVLGNLHAMCKHLLIIDTHVALKADYRTKHNGKSYQGTKVREHADDDPEEVRRSRVGASLDNPESFVFTRESLCQALVDAGFTSVCECHAPFEPTKPVNRVTIVAGKGEPVQLSSYPWVNHKSEDEIRDFLANPDQPSQTQPAGPSRMSARQRVQSAVNVVLSPLGLEIRRRGIDGS